MNSIFFFFYQQQQPSRKISEFEEPEPFKRLNQLGIPRAQIGASPLGSRRAPSSPLPSPIEESDSSSDDEISVIEAPPLVMS